MPPKLILHHLANIPAHLKVKVDLNGLIGKGSARFFILLLAALCCMLIQLYLSIVRL